MSDERAPSKREEVESQRTFAVNVPLDDPIAMEAFQEAMDEMSDRTSDYVGRLALELNVSGECASDIAYLRTRSR